MAASLSEGLIKILESSLKLSKIRVMMKHYKKVSLIKQFLRKVLSLYFDISLNCYQGQNPNA